MKRILRLDVKSKRLTRLVNDVLGQIPKRDLRVILDRLATNADGLTAISDDPSLNAIPEAPFGQTFRVVGGLLVWLNRSRLGRCSDNVVRAIIAHELAHIYFGHVDIHSVETEIKADDKSLAWGFDSRELHRHKAFYESLQ